MTFRRVDPGERAVDGGSRLGPVRAAVGIVARPQHAIDADRVAVLHSVGVGDEHVRQVVLPVVARLLGHGVHCLTGVAIVHLLFDIRNPAAVDLAEHHVQIGVPIERARADQLRDTNGRVEEPHVAA